MLTVEEITQFKAAVRALITEHRIKVFSPPLAEDELHAATEDEIGSSAEIFVRCTLYLATIY